MTYYRIAPAPPQTVIKALDGFAYWKSPYFEQDFRTALWAAIPESDRRWYKGKTTWAVRERYTDALADLVETHYRRRPEIEEAV